MVIECVQCTAARQLIAQDSGNVVHAICVDLVLQCVTVLLDQVAAKQLECTAAAGN